MKFKLSVPAESDKAFEYLTKLAAKGSVVNLTKVSPTRSLSQNNYLYLLLGAFGNHFGYTLEEAKLIYKDINPSIYKYKKKGRTFTRSSADLNSLSMAKSIDKLMDESAKAGYPLPLATDQDWLIQIENEIEQAKYYL